MICELCTNGVPAQPASRKCAKCELSCCAGCCYCILDGKLLCKRCFGVAMTGGDPATTKADVVTPETEADWRAQHPEWFIAPVQQICTEPVNGVPPSLASIMANLNAADLRKQMDALRAELAGLKVLLRVAEAREKKPVRKKRAKKAEAV